MSSLSLLAAPLMLLPMAEGGEEGGLLGAIAVGVGTLVFLLALIFATVAFGQGRDHS